MKTWLNLAAPNAGERRLFAIRTALAARVGIGRSAEDNHSQC